MIREHIPMRGLISALLALVAATALLLVLQPPTSAAPGPAPLPLPVSVPQLQSPSGLQMTKEGPDWVTVRDILTYTLLITNASGQTLQNVVITDTYTTKNPQGSVLFAIYNGNYITYGINVEWFTYTLDSQLRRGEIYWHLGTLAPGASGRIVLTMSIPPGLQPQHDPPMGPSDLENSAVITTSTPGVAGSDDIVVSSIVGPVLKLEKSFQTETGRTDGERVGRLVTYTIRVENLPTTTREDSWPATNLKVWEQLPAYLDFVQAWAAIPGVAVEFTPTARFITWTYPSTFTLHPGETTYVTFTVRVTLTAPVNQPIKNEKWRCRAISAEMINPVQCVNEPSYKALPPQDKTVETTSPPTQADRSYPNRPVTYTVYLYNPLQDVLTDVVVLDHLPSTFVFQQMITGPQPAEILTPNNIVRWEGLTLPPNGVISFTFRVWIGAQTPVGDNCGDKDYFNVMTVTAPALPVPYGATNLAMVKLVPQLRVSKSVYPNLQTPGSLVTYTITLKNEGNTPLTGIILTDTLPTYFRFHSMASSPPGNPYTMGNVIWWDSIPPLAPGNQLDFSFRVIVDGNPQDPAYGNKVEGYSPDTSICRLVDQAKVKVHSPIWYQKTADPPIVVQGETFAYTVRFGNQSSARDYQIDGFIDYLPSGFWANGMAQYTYIISPPFTLATNSSTVWEHTFNVTVLGEGTNTQWCNDLAREDKRNIYQDKDKFGVHTVDPNTLWLNRDKAAPVYVLPHVSLVPVAQPSPVGRNGILTVTLALTNNLRGTYAAPVTVTAVTYQLPRSVFSYTGPVGGTPNPDISSDSNYDYYTWRNLVVPAQGVYTLSFRIRAPFTATTYATYARATPTNSDICIPQARLDIPVVNGVELKKTPNPNSIGPYGLVEYTLEATNLTGEPVYNLRITDTLPFGFQYITTTSGPPPVSLSPLVWEIPYLGSAQSGLNRATIRFQVRSYILVGYQYNWVDGVSASTYVTRINGYENQVRLMVVSGIGLYKVVNPTTVMTGETVVYTITLYNGSETAIQNIRITDTLPAGFTYDGMVSGLPPAQTNPLVWLPPNPLNKGDSIVLAVRARVGEQVATGTYYNRVSGYAEKSVSPYDPVLIPDTGDTAPVYVRGIPTVQRTKTVEPNVVRAGGEVTYTIVLYNESDSPQTLRLTDTLPVSVTWAGMVEGPAPVMTSPVVVWDPISVGVNQTVTLRFRAGVDRLARSGTVYNRLEARAGTFLLPPLETAPLTIQEIPRVDAQVSIGGPQAARPGDAFPYTVFFTNSSPITLENTVLTVTFQPSAYWSVTSGDWNLAEEGVYTYFVGTLPPGETGNVPLGVQVSPAVPESIWTMTATARMDYQTAEETVEENLANNTHRAELAIIWGLRLSKTVDPISTTAGSPVIYTITLQNGLETAIRNIRITDTLPVGFSFDGMISGPQPTQNSPPVWVVSGPLARQASLTLVFRARTDAQMASGSYPNRVSLSAEKNVAPYEPVSADTGYTAPVYVRGIPTVQRTKTVEPEVVRAGREVTYTITLYNESDSPQTLRLTDTLPVSVTWAGMVEGPAPVMTSPVVVWDPISVGVNQTVTLRFRAGVDRLARSGTVYNRLEARAGTFVLPPLETAPLTVQEIPRVDAQVSIDDGRITASPGDTLNYTVRVTNSSSIWLEHIVLTATLEPANYLTVVGGDWNAVGGGVYTASAGTLSPNGSSSVHLDVQVSSGIPDTFWAVTATVDIGYEMAEEVIEENRANNTGRDVDILHGPDLVVTRITWQPAQPTAGYPMTFYVTVKNQGVDAVTQQWNGNAPTWLFVTEVYAKDPQAGPPTDVFDHIGGSCTGDGSFCARWEYTQWSRSLGVNEERTFPFSVTLPAGTYRTHAQVDVSWAGSAPWGQSFGLIREAREDNNIYSGDLLVVYPLRHIYLPLVLRNR